MFIIKYYASFKFLCMINFINIHASVFHMGRYVLANKGMQVEIYIETAEVAQSVIAFASHAEGWMFEF